MHPYVKQQLPCQVLCFIIILLVTSCSVSTQSGCPGVRTVGIYSVISSGYVRIEGRRVVASSTEGHNLQKITIDRHLYLLFDPVAKMFICWNKKFTNLVVKRNPKNLRYCKFEDKVSHISPQTYLRLTTTYNRTKDKLGESEVKFNKNGRFANPHRIMNCLREKLNKTRMPKYKLEQMLNLDTLNLLKNEKNAYLYINKRCAGADFIEVWNRTYSESVPFCCHVKMVQQKHRVADEIADFCRGCLCEQQ